MYYVIQKIIGNPNKHYIAYSISRYITSKNSDNVIMEFNQSPTIKRKWAPKDVIVLITANKALFETALEQLELIRSTHLEKINTIKAKLDNEVKAMVSALQDEFVQIKKNSDV